MKLNLCLHQLQVIYFLSNLFQQYYTVMKINEKGNPQDKGKYLLDLPVVLFGNKGAKTLAAKSSKVVFSV